GRVSRASTARPGSNSNENGTCGGARSPDDGRPRVRTRARGASRCGPVGGEAPGLGGDAARPGAGGPGAGCVRGAAPGAAALGARDLVRPFQLRGSDPLPLVAQERDAVGDGDRDRHAQGARVAAAGVPGDVEAAADDRLLLLGDELVAGPEGRQRAAGGAADG